MRLYYPFKSNKEYEIIKHWLESGYAWHKNDYTSFVDYYFEETRDVYQLRKCSLQVKIRTEKFGEENEVARIENIVQNVIGHEFKFMRV